MTADANSNLYDNSATSLHEGDVESVALTAGATEVKIPAGADVVRIPVSPGETIELPFAQSGMIARLDDGNGNLAVKVGDVTVILLGYTAATGEAPITLLDANGAAVDVAAVVAATDPSIEIATAAGAAGDQGTGVDNNGGVFSPFDPEGGIGGLDAVGGLDPTALHYNLIQRQAIEIEEDDEVDTAPSLVGLSTSHVVNEDDLERSEEFSAKEFEPYATYITQGLAKALGAGSWAGWDGPHEQGNDPFDTDDHEDGSQNNPPLNDSTPNGIDQDREPLTATAVAQVNFFADVPGHLSFSNGATPVVDQLTAMGLTSHSQAIKYLVLPGAADSDPNDGMDDSHGETLVAYIEYTYNDGEDTYTDAFVIFTIGLREFEGTTAPSDFHIDFTIYGVIDNVPGINDADGNILEALDIDVPFFMVDSNGSVTPAPDGALTFTDIDDVPHFGSLIYGEIGGEQGEGEDEGFGGSYAPVGQTPGDTAIVHDETDGEQSPEDQPLQSVQFQVAHALDAAGWSNVIPLGAARTSLDVSFGADGRAGTYDDNTKSYVGNKEAGQTVFTEDGNTYSNAFQFYLGSPETPLTSGLTNWTIMVDGKELSVFAEQVAANVIKGYAMDGETVIPVFVLSIEPSVGEVILTQLHQVNHHDTTDANEATPPLQIYGPGETPTTVTFQDDFNDLTGWTQVANSQVDIVTDPLTSSPQPNPSAAALLVTKSATTNQIESFFGLSSGKLADIADDGDDSNGDENPTIGSAIKRDVTVATGDEMTVRFNFLENEADFGEGGEGGNYQDFAFIVIGGEVIRLANVGEAGIPYQCSAGAFTWSEESGYLTFHFDFAISGTVQIGFGVMNESDSAVDAGLLIDQLLITHGNAGSNVIVRATDYDGDTADAPLDVTIRDDGPTISVTGYENENTAEDEGGSNSGAIGYVDEDWLPAGNNDNDAPASDDIGGVKAVATFAVDYGADGPAKPALSLDAASLVVNGIDGALARSSDGALVKFVLSDDGQTLTGYADANKDGKITADEKIADNKVLALKIVGSTVELELFQALRHDTTSGSGVGDGDIESNIHIGVGVKAIDADGDTASATVEFVVDDDMIVAHDDVYTVAGLGDNKAAYGNLLDNDDIGADRNASVKSIAIDGVPQIQDGNGYTYYLDAAGKQVPVDQAVAAIGVSPNGEWHVTQLKNLDAPVTLTFAYVAQDADGDTSGATLSVTLRHFQPASFEDETAILDEDGIPGKGADDDPVAASNHGDDLGGHQVGGEPNPATESIFRNTLGNSFDWHGDVGAITFTFTDAQLANIVLLDGTVPTLANVEGNGTGHVIVWDGAPGSSEKILELTVIDNATAVYEAQLYQPLAHPGHDNPSLPGQQTFYEDNIDVPVTVTATNNGGAPEHTLTLSIDDDFIKFWGATPNGNSDIHNGDLYQWVDEDFLPSGNQDQNALGNPNYGLNGDDPTLNVNPATVIATNVATGQVFAAFGADGGAALPYSLEILTVGMQFGLNYWGVQDHLQTTLGANLKVLSSSADQLVIADSANVPVMTLTLNQTTGEYSYTLHQALEHHGAGTEDNIYLRFGTVFTDGDGDSVASDIGFVIDDDAPEGRDTTSAVAFAADEAKDEVLSASYGWMFYPAKFGADGAGSTTYTLTDVNGHPLPVGGAATPYLDSLTGLGIKLMQIDATHVEGQTMGSGITVFKIWLENGQVKFDLLRGVDHSGTEFNLLGMNLPVYVTQTITDKDGDSATSTATAGVSVVLTDSAPDAVDDGTTSITQLGSFTGSNLLANDKFGLDGGTLTEVTYAGNSYAMVNGKVEIVVPGGKLTVLDTGLWWFDQPTNMVTPTTRSFSYTVVDADGDSDTATFALALRTAMAHIPATDRLIVSDVAPVDIPTAWFTRNDSDDHKSNISAQWTLNANSGLVPQALFSYIHLDIGNPQNHNPTLNSVAQPDGTFEIMWADGDLNQAQSGVLFDYIRTVSGGNLIVGGGAESEILIGNQLTETISGNGGHDILYGGRDDPQAPNFAVVDILDGGGGDDWLIHGTGDMLFGGTGFDTVRFDKSDPNAIDLDHLGADFIGRTHDIEAIDLRSSGVTASFGNHNDSDNGLSAQDVIDITDDNDTLFILGHGDGAGAPGVDDKVYLDGAWTKAGELNIVDPTGASIDYVTFVKYTSGAATLYIQNTIDVE